MITRKTTRAVRFRWIILSSVKVSGWLRAVRCRRSGPCWARISREVRRRVYAIWQTIRVGYGELQSAPGPDVPQ